MRIHLPIFSAFLLLASIDGFSLPSCSIRRSNINRIELLATRAPPPEISFVDDDDDESSSKPTTKSNAKVAPPDFSIEDDGDDSPPIKKTLTRSPRKAPTESDPSSAGKVSVKKPSPRLRPTRPKRTAVSTKDMAGTSWMDKNKEFANQVGITAPVVEQPTTFKPPPRVRADGTPPPRIAADGYTRSFRQDFRATRVFVQGIPPRTSWQDLKDHFKIAGEVVFASVSVDPQTGVSKGHGIVQYESTEMAEYAIQVMRDHPLNGGVLYVREDVQENSNPDAQLRESSPRGPTPPTKWTCANEDNIKYMSEDELKGIRTLIKARDDARRRRKYDVSDTLRDELKSNYGVFIDDRLKMWWTSMDGNSVPQTIQDINGDGRWGKLTPWRQIPTTPENDACVNPELVEGLLKQRDVARKEKDFGTADRLLEDARVSPDGPLALRIHDESRTWRVWTEAPPPRQVEHNAFVRSSLDPQESRTDAAKQCLDIVMEYAPEKEEEIKLILDKFPGREFGVLKKLKKKYLS